VPPPSYRWIELRVQERLAKRPILAGRTLGDLIFGPDLTRDDVVAMWGPPDFLRGSGIAYSAYRLDDGQETWFEFQKESGRLVVAFVPTTSRSLILEVVRRWTGIDLTPGNRILWCRGPGRR
jgi:hypothetical protein